MNETETRPKRRKNEGVPIGESRLEVLKPALKAAGFNLASLCGVGTGELFNIHHGPVLVGFRFSHSDTSLSCELWICRLPKESTETYILNRRIADATRLWSTGVRVTDRAHVSLAARFGYVACSLHETCDPGWETRFAEQVAEHARWYIKAMPVA